MALCNRFTLPGDVEAVLHNAIGSIRNLEYRSAMDVLRDAAEYTAHPQIRCLMGKCLLFQGQAELARCQFDQAWEAAKRYQLLEDRWEACWGLEQVHTDLHQPQQALQYHQLALAAVFEGLACGEITGLPEEVLLRNALQIGMQGHSEESFQELLRLQMRTVNLHQRAKIEFALALACFDKVEMQQSCLLIIPSRRHRGGAGYPSVPLEGGVYWLEQSWRHFQLSGDLYRAMMTVEQLAERQLAVGNWEQGRAEILRAKGFAVRLGLRSRISTHHNLAARLGRSLVMLNTFPGQN